MRLSGWPSWRVTAALVVVTVLVGLFASTAGAQTPPTSPTPATPPRPTLSGASFGSATPFWLAALLALVAPAATLVGVELTQRNQRQALEQTLHHQTEQEALKDVRNLRDRRFEREAAAYERIYGAAWTMLQNARDMHAMGGGEAKEREWERLHSEVWTELIGARRIVLRLVTAEEGRAIRDAFERMWRTYTNFVAAKRTLDSLPDPRGNPEFARNRADFWKQCAGALQELEVSLSGLEVSMASRLDALSHPIHPPLGK